MAVRIEGAFREGVRDIPAESLKKRIELDIAKRVDAHVVDVYTALGTGAAMGTPRGLKAASSLHREGEGVPIM